MPRKQRSQPTGSRYGARSARALDLPVELGEAHLGLLDGEQSGVQGALQFRHLEPLGPEPRPVGLPPVGAGAIDAAMPEEELDEPMAPANDVLANIVAAAQQVAHRFLRLVGHVDRGQLARAVEADELGRVAAIRLDPLPRAARGESRGDHVAVDPEGRELPVQVVAGYAGLVADADRPLARQTLDEPAEEPRFVGNLPQLRLALPRPQDPCRDRPLAIIEGHVGSILLHDRPPFACGSVLPPRGTTHVYAIGRPVLPYGLKTAKTLGLTIPQSLLQRADRVIQ